MSRASGGGSCPLCGNYASFTTKGKLYVHRGAVRRLTTPGFQECRASGQTREYAQVMRINKDAGRHPFRNADGSWL